jgi:maltooligosyltrehalose synthase
VIPRFYAMLVQNNVVFDPHAWDGMSLDVGEHGRLDERFTGRTFSGEVAVADLLHHFPVAVLTNSNG